MLASSAWHLRAGGGAVHSIRSEHGLPAYPGPTATLPALIANFITFRHRLAGAILTTLLFAAIFVFATYYPHGMALPTLK